MIILQFFFFIPGWKDRKSMPTSWAAALKQVGFTFAMAAVLKPLLKQEPAAVAGTSSAAGASYLRRCICAETSFSTCSRNVRAQCYS